MSNDENSAVGRTVGLVHLAASVVTILTVIGPGLLGLAVALVVTLAVLPTVSVQAFGAGFASALGISSVYLIFSRLNRVRRLSSVDHNRDWRMVENYRSALVKSRTEIDYEFKLAAIALHDGLDTFVWRGTWTGSGAFEPRSLNPSCRVVYDPTNHETPEEIRLILNRPVKAGERVEFAFAVRTRGSREAQKPFYSFTINHLNYPQNSNSIHVQFAPEVQIERVWIDEYRDAAVPWVHRREDKTLDGNRTVSLKFSRRLGRKYAICWSYAAEGAAA